MNRLGVSLLLAAGVFFIDVSPAAAHSTVNRSHNYDHAYHYRSSRNYDMPRWLKRDKQFRHWYRHTPLKRYRQISWRQLFEIYRWERRYFARRAYVAYDDYDRRGGRDRRRYRYDD